MTFLMFLAGMVMHGLPKDDASPAGFLCILLLTVGLLVEIRLWMRASNGQ